MIVFKHEWAGSFLTFPYESKNDRKIVQRVVYCYKINGHLVECYDFGRKAHRNFRVDKIDGKVKSFDGRHIKHDISNFPKNFDVVSLIKAYDDEGVISFYDSTTKSVLGVELPKPSIVILTTGRVTVKNGIHQKIITLPNNGVPYVEDGIVRQCGWRVVIETLQEGIV
jgi:hypothetical protein